MNYLYMRLLYTPLIKVQRLVMVCALCLPMAALAEGDLADPTRPTVLSAPSVDELVDTGFELNSILIGAQRKVAVINGRAVGEGERIDGAQVLRIDTRSVRLRTAEEIIELPLAAAADFKTR